MLDLRMFVEDCLQYKQSYIWSLIKIFRIILLSLLEYNQNLSFIFIWRWARLFSDIKFMLWYHIGYT